MTLSPIVFVAFGIVWLALVIFTVALFHVAAKADAAWEHMLAEEAERREFDALVRERAAAIDPEPLHLVEEPAAVYRMQDWRRGGAA